MICLRGVYERVHMLNFMESVSVDIHNNNVNRVAIITGAARGLGRAISLALAGAGRSVALVDLNGDGVREVAGRCRDAGVEALAFEADASNSSEVDRVVAEIASRLGRLDILVNNAGLNVDIERGPFEDITPEAWDRTMAVNVRSAFLFARSTSPVFRRQKWGRIINMSSVGAYLGLEGYLHYVTSKAALIGMTRALAHELGRDGITVNAVAPGLVQTEVPNPAQTPDRVARAIARQAIPIPLTVTDVTSTVVFLASDEARLITGQTLLVDGGMAHT